MPGQQVDRLFELVIVVLVAVAAVAMLFRLTRQRTPVRDGIVLGYPVDRYPLATARTSAPLQTLSAVQARLTVVASHLPTDAGSGAASDLAIWLRVFLLELRRLMDTAYRVAAITAAYGPSAPLERLVEEIRQLEQQIVDDIAHRLLGGTSADRRAVLEQRLTTLRECARELAGLIDEPAAPATAEPVNPPSG